jgi:glucose-6-phosphate isomerase
MKNKPIDQFNALLKEEALILQKKHIRELFEEDLTRGHTFYSYAEGFKLDFCRERINAHAWRHLLKFASQREVDLQKEQLFTGEVINVSENRPARHTWTRTPSHGEFTKHTQQQQRIAQTFEQTKNIQNIIHVGVGGSDIGLRLLYQALKTQYTPKVLVHYVSSLDPSELNELLSQLNPNTTQIILTSKTCSTLEVLDIWRRLQSWQPPQTTKNPAYVITAQAKKAQELGFSHSQIVEFDESIGGRFSWSSNVGLSILLAFGSQVWQDLLHGASLMDLHFQEAPIEKNLPIHLALLSLWNNWGLHIRLNGIYPYAHALKQIIPHWQQVTMESLGKYLDVKGSPLKAKSGGMWIGGVGTESQHTFFQMLHQGTHEFWSLFLLVNKMQGDSVSTHALQRAAVAQANALSLGLTEKEQQLFFPSNLPDLIKRNQQYQGNHPCSLLYIPELTANILGKLMALLEHFVTAEAFLLGINPFDQFGVELGKRLAMVDISTQHDPSTDSLHYLLTKIAMDHLV